MIRRFDPFLAQFTHPIFFEPEGGGGAGGDPGGDGGGATTLEPPPGGDAPDAGVLDFVAPDLSGVMDHLKHDAPPPESGKKGKKPLEKKIDPPVLDDKSKKTDPEPGDGEKPVAQLRKAYEESKAKLADAEARLAAGDPRLKVLEETVAAKEKEFGELKKRADDYELRLTAMDPNVSAKLREMDAGYNSKAASFQNRVPDIDFPGINSLLMEFQKLPFNKPEYRKARTAWEAKVNARLGAEEGTDHRKLGQVIDFIEYSAEFVNERNVEAGNVAKFAREKKFEGDVQAYDGKVKTVKELLTRSQQVSDDLRTANPLHPDVVLDLYLNKVMTPEQKATLEKGIDDFIMQSEAGLKPRSEGDYVGMTKEQIAESRATESAQMAKAAEARVLVMAKGIRALRLIPSLQKEIARLRAAADKRRDGQPPDPSNGGADGGEVEADIKDFKAPDPRNWNRE